MIVQLEMVKIMYEIVENPIQFFNFFEEKFSTAGKRVNRK